MKKNKHNNLIKKLCPFIQYKNNELLVEGIPARELVNQFSTPLAIYSLSRINNNCRTIKTIFSNECSMNTQFFYALKSCYFLPVLNAIQSQKFGVEIVSRHEYKIAKKAGWLPSSMIWNSPGKTNSDLKLAVNNGVQINVDSEHEFEKLKHLSHELKKQVQVLLRINTNPLQPPLLPPSRMGIDIHFLPNILKSIQYNDHIKIIGLHSHGLINETHTGRYIRWVEWLLKLCLQLKTRGIEIKVLNLGGGLAPRSLIKSDFTPFANAITKTFKKYKFNPHLIQLEPGRSIVSDAGVVITRILAKKRVQNTNWLIVDVGCNYLIPLKSKNYYVLPVEQRHGAPKAFSIGDPTGFIPGIIQEKAFFPEPKEGDLLCVLYTGAYTFSMQSSYGIATPTIVAVKNKTIYK